MKHVKLPWELVEEILYRVQPLSIIRFKIVCKQWNALFETRSFVNNHLLYSRPQFFLRDNSKVYSVSVTLKNDPKIEVCELPFDIPFPNTGMYIKFFSCDGLFSCEPWPYDYKIMVFNPWLKQTKWIESEERYKFHGIGYDSGIPERGLKIFGSNICIHNEEILQGHQSVVIFNFETNECKYKCFDGLIDEDVIRGYYVSLDGNFYGILANTKTNKYFIESFDFSKEIYRKVFCVLPWDMTTFKFPRLSTFSKDRLLVLTDGTNNVEVLVTKNKVNIEDGDNIEWMKFMTVSIPISNSPSYFVTGINKNNLVMCCNDENGKLCIYIVKDNAVTKIPIGFNARHYSYVPSLIPVP